MLDCASALNGAHKHRGKHRRDVTHYVIQLEPLDGKTRIRKRESFGTSTASNTTAEAKLLGLTRDELRRRKMINDLNVPAMKGVDNLIQQMHQPQQQQGQLERQAFDTQSERHTDDGSSTSQERPVATCG